MYLQIGCSLVSVPTRLVAKYTAIMTELPEINALLHRLFVYDYCVLLIAVLIQITPLPKTHQASFSEITVI